jgi:hypothetical protein
LPIHPEPCNKKEPNSSTLPSRQTDRQTAKEIRPSHARPFPGWLALLALALSFIPYRTLPSQTNQRPTTTTLLNDTSMREREPLTFLPLPFKHNTQPWKATLN